MYLFSTIGGIAYTELNYISPRAKALNNDVAAHLYVLCYVHSELKVKDLCIRSNKKNVRECP